jgi:serine O-acetyltransferase
MPNRLRYRLHATLELARCPGTEPEPTGFLAKREILFQKCLPALPAFLARLPTVQRAWATDFQAAYTGHPAAASCLAHDLHGLGAPPIPQMITGNAYSITGIDTHPACQEFDANR